MDVTAGTVHLMVPPAVHGVVASFGLERDAAIEHGLVLSRIEPVLAILVVVGVENKIAVLGVIDVIGVGRKFSYALRNGNPPDGNFMEMFVQLLEKRSGKIVIAGIVFRIPFIRPPTLCAIDRIGRIWPVHGYLFLPAQVAFALIELKTLEPCQASLKPASWAKRRRRNTYLLVEIKVVGFYRKILMAILTIFCFLIHKLSFVFRVV